MKKQMGTLAAVCLAIGGTGFLWSTAAIGQSAGATPPPNVLVVEREFLKPGMAGAPHEKTESAFVDAMKQAHSQEHYIAMTSLSGKSRALFFLGYDSLGDWGKDIASLQGNSAFAQQFDEAQQADGKLLTSMDSSVFAYVPDKSLNANINVGEMRFWEITLIKIRMGHDADWDQLAKLHNSIYASVPNAHWAVWNKLYGADSGSIVIVTEPLKSLDELDANRKAGHEAWSKVSADQKKKIEDLEGATFESIESNLFSVDPKMSYAADSWKSADPGFWGQQ